MFFKKTDVEELVKLRLLFINHESKCCLKLPSKIKKKHYENDCFWCHHFKNVQIIKQKGLLFSNEQSF